MLQFLPLSRKIINAAKNILRQGLSNVYSQELSLTDMEGKALDSSNTIETGPVEVSKKKNVNRKVYVLKPLGLA